MKTVISIPDAVFRSAERMAARLNLSRSELPVLAAMQASAVRDNSAW